MISTATVAANHAVPCQPPSASIRQSHDAAAALAILQVCSGLFASVSLGLASEAIFGLRKDVYPLGGNSCLASRTERFVGPLVLPIVADLQPRAITVRADKLVRERIEQLTDKIS
jgi:hypothetical protein